MKMYLILLFWIFAVVSVKSQVSDSLYKTLKVAPVRAYFQGYLKSTNEDGSSESFEMRTSYFKQDFSLSLSDTTYKVSGYSFTFDMPTGDIITIRSKNEVVKIEGNKYAVYFKELNSKCLVAVDNIILIRDGKYFKGKSFLCKLVD